MGAVSNQEVKMQNTFETAADALKFVKGGNATITCTSGKTGEHKTFKIKQAWDKTTNKRDFTSPFFVSVLRGDPNEDDFQFIGFFFADTQRLLPSRITGLAPCSSFTAFDWILKRLVADELPASLTIQHSGHCCRCGREITHPDSIARGIGPECAKHF
jgi:hypothetical protein